ncbi:hypothetical protein BUALT_Bualt09G0129300 [Buddleja alternifolia]|uniref:Uncharacterized protein n=1 Tax=Buddleja alternifolia TaxID=168488 RepID=A0AAV6X3V7_9LAMI|nr:hypothetical protein BUALT_Bualt09G0129300 [Buddleja alternifolia]
MNMEGLMSYGNNLIEFLKEDKDIVGLKHFLRHSEALQSQCLKDFSEVQNSIQDYEKKIDACKQKAAEAASESAADAELDSLQKEMKLSMYASVTNIIPYLDDPSKISGLIRPPAPVNGFSFNSNILDIVEREKKVVEKFEFDPPKVTAFDTCNNIWKMINL